MTMTWSPDKATGHTSETHAAPPPVVRSAEQQDADDTLRRILQWREQMATSGGKGATRKRRLIGR